MVNFKSILKSSFLLEILISILEYFNVIESTFETSAYNVTILDKVCYGRTIQVLPTYT